MRVSERVALLLHGTNPFWRCTALQVLTASCSCVQARPAGRCALYERLDSLLAPSSLEVVAPPINRVLLGSAHAAGCSANKWQRGAQQSCAVLQAPSIHCRISKSQTTSYWVCPLPLPTHGLCRQLKARIQGRLPTARHLATSFLKLRCRVTFSILVSSGCSAKGLARTCGRLPSVFAMSVSWADCSPVAGVGFRPVPGASDECMVLLVCRGALLLGLAVTNRPAHASAGAHTAIPPAPQIPACRQRPG